MSDIDDGSRRSDDVRRRKRGENAGPEHRVVSTPPGPACEATFCGAFTLAESTAKNEPYKPMKPRHEVRSAPAEKIKVRTSLGSNQLLGRSTQTRTAMGQSHHPPTYSQHIFPSIDSPFVSRRCDEDHGRSRGCAGDAEESATHAALAALGNKPPTRSTRQRGEDFQAVGVSAAKCLIQLVRSLLETRDGPVGEDARRGTRWKAIRINRPAERVLIYDRLRSAQGLAYRFVICGPLAFFFHEESAVGNRFRVIFTSCALGDGARRRFCAASHFLAARAARSVALLSFIENVA